MTFCKNSRAAGRRGVAKWAGGRSRSTSTPSTVVEQWPLRRKDIDANKQHSNTNDYSKDCITRSDACANGSSKNQQRTRVGQKKKVYLRRTLSYILSRNLSFQGLQRTIMVPDRRNSRSTKALINFYVVTEGNQADDVVGGGGRRVTSITDHEGHFGCPFCPFLATCHYGVWFHCNTDHSDDFHFRDVVTYNGTHVVVTPRKTEGGSVGNQQQQQQQQQSNTDHFDCTTNATELLYWHTGFMKSHQLSVKPCNVPFLSTQKIHLPKRKLYRSVTFQPVQVSEWIAEVNSEDEIDESWKTLESEHMIDEFDDLTPSEKEFFKLWNQFLQSSGVIVRANVLPDLCKRFVQEKAHFLQYHKLDAHFISHLLSMWDEGHISCNHFVDCMKQYEEVVGGKNK